MHNDIIVIPPPHAMRMMSSCTLGRTRLHFLTAVHNILVHFAMVTAVFNCCTLSDPTSNDPTTSQVSKAQLVTSHFYTSLKLLLSTYWVLAVIGAFLLVTLAGQPSLLKTVYLVFFFIFLITYQVCWSWDVLQVQRTT